MYRDTMVDAGFEAHTPLFVATGLLSYGAEMEFHVRPSMSAADSAWLPCCKAAMRWPVLPAWVPACRAAPPPSTRPPRRPPPAAAAAAILQAGASLLIHNRLCSEVLYKEQYLPPFELQRALPGPDAACIA